MKNKLIFYELSPSDFFILKKQRKTILFYVAFACSG